MKKIILFSFSILISGILSAQGFKVTEDFKYSLSTPYEVIDGIKYYFGRDGEALTLKKDGTVCYIQKFKGKTLDETSRKEFSDFPKGFAFEQVAEVNKRIYVFYSLWDKAASKEQLFVREIDFDKGSFIGQGKRIITVDGKISGGNGNKFQFETSFDEDNILVRYRKVPESRSDAINFDIIGMYAFDSALEELAGSEVKMPYTEAKMNNIAYTIDKNGTIFILTEVFKNDSRKKYEKDGTPNYKLGLFSIIDGSIEENYISDNLNKKFIKEIGFFEGPNNLLYIAGYYGNSWSNGVDGLFYFSVDEKADLSTIKFAEIPVEIMRQYETARTQKALDKKDAKGADLSMGAMTLRNLVVSSDGSVLFIGEKYYTVTTYNASTKTTTTTYYYEEILMSKISKDGELEWMRKLPKRQIGKSGRGGMGFKYVRGENDYYVLFLDHIDNLHLDASQTPKPHSDGRGGFLTGYKVSDENGEVSKVSILDTRDAGGIDLFQFSTERIFKINDNEFALECYAKKKQDVMIKISLK